MLESHQEVFVQLLLLPTRLMFEGLRCAIGSFCSVYPGEIS